MKIDYNPAFITQLNSILQHISKDSPTNARKFKDQLKDKIKNLPSFPFKYRKSYYFDDENTRDYIFKGYTIPYYIDLENNTIVILDIFKWLAR